MELVDTAVCPVCWVIVGIYRTVTVNDTRGLPQGMTPTPTGPRHFVNHGCAGDHERVE